jgi:hypothetical protein
VAATKDDDLSFTDGEKQEIVEAFQLLLDEDAKEEEKDEYFGSLRIRRDIKPEELCIAHELFVYRQEKKNRLLPNSLTNSITTTNREPELWEHNLMSLEKGEWGPNMRQENFKRWGTHKRPRLPSCFLKPNQQNFRERRDSMQNVRLFQVR